MVKGFDGLLLKHCEDFGCTTLAVLAKMNIGDTIQALLIEAQKENRLICGLNNASKYLKETENPEHSLFFFVASSSVGDSLAHIQEVVLQSFCFENDIYIIKIDDSEKLTRIVGSEQNVSCALIQKYFQQGRKKYSEMETRLIDHCEDFWDELVQPIIKLPDE